MTLRSLPAPRQPERLPANLAFGVHPQARGRWDKALSSVANADSDAVISILDVIGYDYWSGEGVTDRGVATALRAIGDRPVTVQINSPGGNFFEGLAIYNRLRQHPQRVTVQIIGIAASAASLISMAGDEIQIGKAALTMIHNAQWVAEGDRHEIAEVIDIMAVFDEVIAGLYVDRTGNTAADVTAWLDATTYMSGEETVARGFADGFLPADVVSRMLDDSEQPAAYRLERILAQHNVPRAERRKAIRDFTAGMPGAASGNAKPGAGESEGADALDSLRLASARLSLLRA